MKILTKTMAVAMLLISLLPGQVLGAEVLVPVGQVVGLELRDHAETVAAFDETLGAKAKEAGVRVGDRILRLDGQPVGSAEDVRRILSRSDGTVEAVLVREGKEIKVTLEPEPTSAGPKLGLFLRQGITGVGTVTWYDPATGKFGTLGHGVNNSSGTLLTLEEGSAYYARVMAVKKGVPGEPGQLMGALESRTPAGKLTANTQLGVFGVSETGWSGQTVAVAEPEEVKTGKAVILSTVSGNEVREYSVEIVKIYSKAKGTGKNLLLKVTDPALLEATGGIVQGMSGSPIIQDGKLVGAVTHVLVNDPTRGYGIFIENMLDAAA